MDSSKDAISLLKKDHAAVKNLFKRFEKSASDKEKENLASEICQMLTVHATCEEELVYPAAREIFDDEDQDLVNEATVEHGTAKDLIGQIERMSASDEMFDATVKVLSEYINHHVEEEEGEMFPLLEKSELDLDDIGQRVAERKEELTNELGANKAKAQGPGRAGKSASRTTKTKQAIG